MTVQMDDLGQSLSQDELTHDAFLGGRVQAWQPRKGFRSGIDAVLLAAAVPAQPGQHVLELGCGVGVASLCLNARVPGLRLAGVDMQDAYVRLARRNASQAQANLTVEQSTIPDLPLDIRQTSFDHVFINPPYFDRDKGSDAADGGRDLARGGSTSMADWIDTATRRLKPGGVLTLVQRVAQLPVILASLSDRLGHVRVLPLAPRDTAPPSLFLLSATKGRRTPFELRPTCVLHSGPRHGAADNAYRPEIEAVLRHAAPLTALMD
ncbi:MAG: methyltransferase [Pseudomonadota bacterium]